MLLGKRSLHKNAEAQGQYEHVSVLEQSGCQGIERNKNGLKHSELCPALTRKWILDQLRGWH